MPRRFFAPLFIALILLAALAPPVVAQTNASTIFTQGDGIAPGLTCKPQLGAGDTAWNANCCGAPGLRACGQVLHAGKGSFGLSAGCTDPTNNVLRTDPFFYSSTGSYADPTPTLCGLPWPPVPESVNLLSPNRPPTGRNFSFYVTSDLHYWRTGIDFTTSVLHASVINQFAAHPPAWPSNNPVSDLSHGFQPPVAIVQPGDLTTDAVSQRMGAYRLLWERGWNQNSINYPVYMGFGNHDSANDPTETGWGIQFPENGQRRWDYQLYRTMGLHADRNHTGCLIGVTLGCIDELDLGGSLNYSWDWQGVHFVMLNTWAGDTDRSYFPPLGMDGLKWLKNDLEYYVGSSNRPVVLFQHYPIKNAGQWYFPTAGYNSFKGIIDPYNVVAALVGHSHMLSANSGVDLASGTHMEDIEDGSGGDCGNTGCTGGDASFLDVRMTDNYMEVSAATWNDTTLNNQLQIAAVPGAWTTCFASPNGSCPASCRRLIRPKTTVDPSKVSAQAGTGQIIVKNNSSVDLPGTFIVQSSGLNQWDFSDNCSSQNSNNFYLTVSTSGIPHNGTIVVPLQGTPGNLTLYSLNDVLVVDQNVVSLGGAPVTVKVSTLSGAAPNVTVAVTEPWVGFTTSTSGTTLSVNLSLIPQASYAQTQAALTITPSDHTMLSTFVVINLLAPVHITANLPNPVAASGRVNISDAFITVNGGAVPLPYSSTALPGTSLDLDVSLPSASGKIVTFLAWSDGGAKHHSVTVPATGLNLAAGFNTAFQVTTAVTPPGSGTVALSPFAIAGFYQDGADVKLTATPAANFHFVDYAGGISSTNATYLANVIAPLNITARFAANPTITVSTNLPANEVYTVSLTGKTGAAPLSSQFAIGAAIVISVPGVVNSVNTGARYRFHGWADNDPRAARNVTVGASSTTYQALYDPEYQVTTVAQPLDAGVVTGGGWFAAGFHASIHAAPLIGFQLANFSNGLTGSQNPATVTVNSPLTIVANFTYKGTPRLYAAPGGAASDSPSGRVVPLVLHNAGTGGALGAAITSIDNITVVSGSGPVSVLSGPVSFDEIAPNASPQRTILMNWPDTATRIQMTVHFTANDGTYSDKTVLNLFR